MESLCCSASDKAHHHPNPSNVPLTSDPRFGQRVKDLCERQGRKKQTLAQSPSVRIKANGKQKGRSLRPGPLFAVSRLKVPL